MLRPSIVRMPGCMMLLFTATHDSENPPLPPTSSGTTYFCVYLAPVSLTNNFIVGWNYNWARFAFLQYTEVYIIIPGVPTETAAVTASGTRCRLEARDPPVTSCTTADLMKTSTP